MMQDLEAKLDELFVKNAPYQLPKGWRESIVKFMPWASVIAGVLILAVAWTQWALLSNNNIGPAIANSLGVPYILGPAVPSITPAVWISLALLIAEAIIFFTAYPSLAMRKKHAWNLLYYASLLSVLQAVVQVIGYTSVGTLIVALLASAIGLYVLFQIRGHYTVDAPPASGGQTPDPTKK